MGTNCNCNDRCFTFMRTYCVDDMIRTVQVFKCNKFLYDSTKKTSCDFLEEKTVNETTMHENKVISENLYSSDIAPTNINYEEEIEKLLQYYFIRNTNYFAKLNHLLAKAGYHTHHPCDETFDQLRQRLNESPYQLENRLYYYEKQKKQEKSTENKDIFAWTKHEDISDILSRLTVNKKSSKNNSPKKGIKVNGNSSKSKMNAMNLHSKLNELEKHSDADLEHPKKPLMNVNSSTIVKKQPKNEPSEDDEFDVDNYSDDDIIEDNYGYDDFSD
jgi:hypothetical protein